MRILVTGAAGGVGKLLAARLAGEHEVLACDRARLNITDREAVRATILEFRPDVVVNPAAMTYVDACESQPALAELVNGVAPGYLAEAAEAAGACFVQVSTDYVFDGAKGAPYAEQDDCRPINIYGRTKRRGEIAALAACSRAYVARTAWVMNLDKPGFLRGMVDGARAGVLRVGRQTGSPTGIRDLVEGLATLALRQPPFGIYHLVNAGGCSRKALAEEVFRLLGARGEVQEVSLSELYAAPRPEYSVLAADAWRRAGLPPLRPWQEALADMLAAVRR